MTARSLSRRMLMESIAVGLAGATVLVGGAVTMAAMDDASTGSLPLPVDPRFVRADRERQMLLMFRDLPERAQKAYLVHVHAFIDGRETFEEALLNWQIDSGVDLLTAQSRIEAMKAESPHVGWTDRGVRR